MVQLVVCVDMSAFIGLVRLLVVFILGAGIFGLIRLIGVVRLVDMFTAVQTRRHIAAGVDDISITIFGLPRGNLTVAVAVTFNGGIFFAGFGFEGVDSNE